MAETPTKQPHEQVKEQAEYALGRIDLHVSTLAGKIDKEADESVSKQLEDMQQKLATWAKGKTDGCFKIAKEMKHSSSFARGYTRNKERLNQAAGERVKAEVEKLKTVLGPLEDQDAKKVVIAIAKGIVILRNKCNAYIQTADQLAAALAQKTQPQSAAPTKQRPKKPAAASTPAIAPDEFEASDDAVIASGLDDLDSGTTSTDLPTGDDFFELEEPGGPSSNAQVSSVANDPLLANIPDGADASPKADGSNAAQTPTKPPAKTRLGRWWQSWREAAAQRRLEKQQAAEKRRQAKQQAAEKKRQAKEKKQQAGAAKKAKGGQKSNSRMK